MIVTNTKKISLNIPNILTISRIAIIPLVVGTLYFSDGLTFARWVAAGLFVLAALSDFLDGYLARIWQQQSEFGRMLDPVADKLLVSAVTLMLVYEGTITDTSVWAALIILCREILVSGLREYLAQLDVPLHVTVLAKWKTVLQMLAIMLLLIGPASGRLGFVLSDIGLSLFWIAATLTMWTGTGYLTAAITHALK
ncbi:MAG TPA: CDP-diacylglycerol--glycerol-3-phosphate 3-phosphatidyltransferase [Hyphomicrobiaceae bacterium MAG_BT-2024]